LPSAEPRYRVKGLVYMRTYSFFEEKFPGRLELIGRLLDPPVKAFFAQTFLASGWYDALPIAPLVIAEASLCAQSVPDYLEARATWQADQDIHSVYRILLRLASPGMVAARLARIMGQVLSFGTTEIVDKSDHGMKGVVRGMPEILGPWYSGALTVYGRRALTLAGAKAPRCDLVRSERVGHDADGLALADLHFEVAW
jgi:hypothetical protein